MEAEGDSASLVKKFNCVYRVKNDFKIIIHSKVAVLVVIKKAKLQSIRVLL